MKSADLGRLWEIPIKKKTTLSRASEAIIERVYRQWLAPGEVAVDCGANVGRHLFPLADAVGTDGLVYGFEPIPEFAAKLQITVSERSLQDRVKVQALAVSDQAGTSDFHYNLTVPAMSGLKVRDGLPEGSTDEIIRVRVDTLDNLVAARLPQFVKIDVEGAEYSVFRGAEKVMRESRPLFAFEDGRGASAALNRYNMADFYAYFESLQYAVVDMFGYRVNNEMSAYNGPWNFYAAPIERFDHARECIMYGSLYELWAMVPP